MDRVRIIGPRRSDAAAMLAQWLSADDTVKAHTSGSTGTPKPIALKKSDMLLSASNTVEFFNLTADSLLALPLSLDYIAGKMMVVRAAVSGATLWAGTPGNATIPSEIEPLPRISLMAVVPSQVSSLLQSGAYRKIDSLIVGGAPMAHELEQQLVAAGVNAYATYGMTETCSHVALRRVGSSEYRALPGFAFDVDMRGCLEIQAPGFSFDRLTTNDAVELIDHCTFRWLGRMDNVINSGGIKLHPEQLEPIIEPAMGGRPFYLTSRKSQRWGEELVLMVEGTDVDVEAISAQLTTLLDSKHRPKAIITTATFNRTASGKIRRTKL